MTNPFALIRNIVAPKPMTKAEAASAEYMAMIPPYLRDGYIKPVQTTAADLMRKRAKWPLVWVTDIHGFDSISNRNSGQAAFTLTKPGGDGAGASFTCRVPLHEGELFDKEGAYLLIALPATDEAQVEAILRLAEGV